MLQFSQQEQKIKRLCGILFFSDNNSAIHIFVVDLAVYFRGI